MRPVLRKWLRRALMLAALGVAAFVLLAVFASDRLTGLWFGPLPSCPPPPAEAGVVEIVGIPAVDGTTMEGWFFAARREPGTPPRALVVHAHGNAMNLEYQWRGAKWLADRGFDVVAFDYRGFGNSPGRPTRASALQDVTSAIEWAQRRARGRGLPVVLFGQSIGAALSLEAGAARADLGAIVLDCPFDSWPDVGANVARRSVVRLVARPMLRVALHRSGPALTDVAARVNAPLFIVCGGADTICPPAMSHELAGRAGCQLLEIEGAKHVGQRNPEQRKEANDAIVGFLDGALARRHSPGA